MKRLMIVYLSLALNSSAFSQEITWTGNSSADWSAAGNWSANKVPTPCNKVIIPSVTPKPSPVLSKDIYLDSLVMSGGKLATNGKNIKFVKGGAGLLPIVYQNTIIQFPINGVTFSSHSPFKSYSINESVSTCAPIYRFEIRPGEHWANDSGNIQDGEIKERVELSQVNPNIPFGNISSPSAADTANISIAYSIFIEPGDSIIYAKDDFHLYLNQWKNSGSAGGPPWALKLALLDSVQFETRSYLDVWPTSGDLKTMKRHTAFVSRGKWHNFVIKVKHSKTATGRIEWWIDGIKKFGVTGIPIGLNESTLGYFKFGIYRTAERGVGTTQVVRYANVEVKTGWNSLDARIANPLPLD